MQLKSPVSDAEDMTLALQKLGYRIIGGKAVTNASREQMTTAAEQFTVAARNAEAAVFYFSGHGIQVGEDNYLLPTDTPELKGLSMLKNRGVLLRDSVMVALEEVGASSKVIILDCCRDNPFAAQLDAALNQIGKSVKTKSLGEITGYGSGFYLAFATSPGQTAADGNGARNSPFTAAMLKTLPGSAGKDIDFFFRDVKAILPEDQVSWTNHSLKASFTFASSAIGSFPNAPLVNRAESGAGADSAMAADLARMKAELEELRIRSVAPVVQTQPPAPAVPDLPGNGFFDLNELFSVSPYSKYNKYSKGRILSRAQELLRREGFYSSAPDGSPGRSTQQALIEWQRKNQVTVTGRLSPDTLVSMRLSNLPPESEPEVRRPRPQTPKVAKVKPQPAPAAAPAPVAAPVAAPPKPSEMSADEFLRRARELEN